MTCPAGMLSRDILHVTGDDRITFLQGLLTQDMARREPGDMAFAALLTPQGKIIDTMVASVTGDGVFLDVAAGRGAGLRQKLALYRLRAKVAIEDVSDRYRVVVGPSASALPEAAVISGPDPRLAAAGHRALIETATGEVVDEAYTAHLIALGVPRMGVDFGEGEVFPLDVNLDHLKGIDHRKGCFVGQEVASRMFRKGEIRKRTYRVEAPSLTKGAAITAGDKTVGTVTSAEGDRGLALVRLDRLEGADTGFAVEGEAARLARPDYFPAD